jgi:hypothetical protein
MGQPRGGCRTHYRQPRTQHASGWLTPLHCTQAAAGVAHPPVHALALHKRHASSPAPEHSRAHWPACSNMHHAMGYPHQTDCATSVLTEMQCAVQGCVTAHCSRLLRCGVKGCMCTTHACAPCELWHGGSVPRVGIKNKAAWWLTCQAVLQSSPVNAIAKW